jgi:glycosyltransferase involved in cell wall biosynthesis
MLVSLEYTPALNGGVGTTVYELALGLIQAGHQVVVLTYTPDQPSTLRQPGLEVHFIPSSASDSGSVARLSMVQGILALNDDMAAYGAKLIAEQERRPDVIAYFNFVTFRAASGLGEMFGIPVVGHISFLIDPPERWWGQASDPELVAQERYLYSNSDELMTVSRSMQSLIHEMYGVPECKIHLVHSGLNPQPFMRQAIDQKKIEKLRQVTAPAKEKIIIFAGRLNPQKGISALFESAARVVEEYPDVRYLIAGEADSQSYGQQVKVMFAQYGSLKGRMKFLGKVPREQLAILYRIADLAVMPSVYEPFGYVAIETMAAAVPAIATDQGGFHDIIQHGETGLLVPVREETTGLRAVDVEQLAQAQVLLLRDEAMAKSIGAAGQQHVLKEFTLEKMAGLAVSVFQKMIPRFHGRSH